MIIEQMSIFQAQIIKCIEYGTPRGAKANNRFIPKIIEAHSYIVAINTALKKPNQDLSRYQTTKN